MNRPRALAINADAVPLVFRQLRRWAVFRYQYEPKTGRWAKMPLRVGPRVTNPRRFAKSNDSDTWGTFAEALAACQLGNADGLLFALGDRWACIDLDHCRDAGTGSVLPTAQAIIDAAAGAYREISPSGTGVKIFGRADQVGVEINFAADGSTKVTAWTGARFAAVTGHVVGDPGDPTADIAQLIEYWTPTPQPAPNDGEPALDWRALIGAKPTGEGTENLPGFASTGLISDAGLLRRAQLSKNGTKFQRLWTGDHSAYASRSEADLALCCALAFWTQCDGDRMDQLFRRSGLYRDKWNAASYRCSTIRKAIALTVNVYLPLADTVLDDDDEIVQPSAPEEVVEAAGRESADDVIAADDCFTGCDDTVVAEDLQADEEATALVEIGE